jgi:hypothetical protein
LHPLSPPLKYWLKWAPEIARFTVLKSEEPDELSVRAILRPCGQKSSINSPLPDRSSNE